MKYPILWTDVSHKNQWVCFRKAFMYEKGAAILQIAVDSKYVLYVNGEMVVFDGGLNRGPDRASGYYDEVDITGHVKGGENLLAVLVWYWGNEGRCNYDSGVPGLSFAVLNEGKTLCSSAEAVKCVEHPCYGQSLPPLPSYLYGGDNITYYADSAWANWYQSEYDDSVWPVAVEQEGSWGELEKRPIPQFYFTQVRPYEYVVRDGEYYICDLPKAAHVSPYLKVTGLENQRIDIRTDRYEVHGGPGDSHHTYNSQRVDYFTTQGKQEFLALYWYFGEKVIYHVPAGVQVLELGYMESGYDCEEVPHYNGKNAFEQKLMEKCVTTLRVCMRDNFMDCPDRERGQWIGDVSVQAPQVFAVLDERAVPLMEKGIYDFIRMRRGAALCGNVPGVCSSELPSQSLVSIGKYGMIAEYFRHSGDREIISFCLEPMVDYVKLWEMDERGLVVPRHGDWYWFDHLDNIDTSVLENCIYYCALDFIRETAQLLGRQEHMVFLAQRMATIRQAVRAHFLQEDGYRSGESLDERANAWAMLSGIAQVEEYERIRKVLMSQYYCTPYMEYFVLKALMDMGFYQDAYARMVKRYTPLVENENSTLWEDFDILGTHNHAWSGGAMMVLCQDSL